MYGCISATLYLLRRLFSHLNRHPALHNVCTLSFILGLVFSMGIISVLGAIANFFFGSEDRPQQPPPQGRPPQRPQKPHKPHKPQGVNGRPPQSYPPSTSPPKQHKPHSPRPSRYQRSVRTCLRISLDCKLTVLNLGPHSIISILHNAYYCRHYHQQDLNQANQDDPHYVSLRARAKDEGDKMASCFEESTRAYTSGDKAGAKTLSNEGKGHKAMMEQLNAEASAWVYASESCGFSNR